MAHILHFPSVPSTLSTDGSSGSLIEDSLKIYGEFSNTEAIGATVPLPDLLFELSLGEVIIILIVVTLILLVLAIERTQANATKAMLYQPTQSMIMKDCPARFGFLQKLPRGGTIPEECYVCAQLVECLGFQRNPRV